MLTLKKTIKEILQTGETDPRQKPRFSGRTKDTTKNKYMCK